MTMTRQIVEVEAFMCKLFGCSQCSWIFSPQGMVEGETIEEMTKNFMVLRHEHFQLHQCEDYQSVQSGTEQRPN